MTAPSFQIDQPTGAGTGTAGVSRKDLWISKALNFTCTNPPGGASFTWTLLYAPPGSSAAITNSTSVVAHFTPDENTQTFRFSLQINAGGPGMYFTFLVSCPFNSSGTQVNRGWRTPAENEQYPQDAPFSGDVNGYAFDYDKIIFDLLANAVFTGGVQNGVVFVNAGAPIGQMTTTKTWADVDTTSSGLTVKAPTAASLTGLTNYTFTAYDASNNAGTNNITINGNGSNIEDPSHPGSFGSTGTIAVNSGAFTWYWNGTKFKIV